MSLRHALLGFSLLLLGACDSRAPVSAPAPIPSATATVAGESAGGDPATRIEAHVAFLADDLLEGREAGTRGYDLAALYIATQYRLLGLQPAGDGGGYFQAVPMLSGSRIADGARFEVERGGTRTVLALETDWLPGINYAEAQFELTAPMVFVGHAVQASEFDYDDFAGVDLRGKIAVYFPKAPARFPNDQRAFYSSSTEKARQLEARGAIGAIVIGDPRDEAKRPWDVDAKNWRRPGMRLLDTDGIPIDSFPALRARASLRSGAAGILFEGSAHAADAVFAMLREGKLESFDLTGSVTLAGKAALSRVTSRNVVARLRGADPTLAREHVVFSAHLDHLGIGAPVAGDAIYNGALDNALGVAIMLESANALAGGERPKRSVLFVALTAEEEGLLGAEQFARRPTVPPDSLVANVNMDMPIILEAQNDVVPIGIEHSSLQGVVERAAREIGVKLSPDPFPEEVVFIRSDQYAFIKRGIPAVYLNGGMVASEPGKDAAASMRAFLRHAYHQPSDDLAQPIHYATAARLAALNQRIGLAIANDVQRPRWNEGDFFGEKFGAPGNTRE